MRTEVTSGERPGGLVGRARELAQLQRSLDGALAGRGALVLLTGEPGIGKTTLAREFVDRATRRGAAWAWGSCWEGGGAPAFWPWVQVCRTLVGRADGDELRAALGPGAAQMAGLLPELAGAPGVPERPWEPDSEQARFRLFDALATLLATISRRRALVVVLDDLHGADTGSLLALEFVARLLPEWPLLAIASYRHAEAHARPELAAALSGLARVGTRLPLHGLGCKDVAQLAASRARGLRAAEASPIPPALVAAVHERSGGNPFFVDELIQLLAAQGRLHDPAAALGRLPLPSGVREVIRRRLEPLEAAAREVIEAAAVLGGEFSLHLLAAMLDRSPEAVLAALEDPLRADVIRATREAGRYEFAHALVRDTLLEGLGAAHRARLHRCAAEALERGWRDEPEPRLAEIAHHYLQAASDGAAERAVDYAARAAGRAAEQFAYEEAARLFERAIAVAASLPPSEQRSWELAQGLGEARMRAGDVDGARTALRAAAAHARRLDDPGPLAQTALAWSLGAISPGLVEGELVALLKEALRRADAAELDDVLARAVLDGLRCRLRVQLALALYWSPHRDEREWLVDEALALARAIYSGEAARASREHRMLADRTLAFALAHGFMAVWGPDTVPRGLPIFVEALELCERTGDAELAMQLRLWRIGLLLELDDRARAEEEIEAFGAAARRLRQPRMLVHEPLHRAMRAHMDGQPGEAERLAAEVGAGAREATGSIAPVAADALRVLVLRAQGRTAEVEQLARRGADRLPAMRHWRCALALALAELGRADEARRELDQLAAADFADLPRDGLWLVAIAQLAELCALLDDAGRARRLYELLAPYEGRHVVAMGAGYHGPVARYLGLLAATVGEAERALGHLETARSAAERMGARPAAALAALDAAVVLARRGSSGDAERARSLVQRAADDAARMGMEAAITRADELLARLEEPDAGLRASLAPRRAALRHEQDMWLLDYDGRSTCLHDARGLHHLAALLASPGERIPALELDGVRAGERRRRAASDEERERALELGDELAAAQAHNDIERVARVRRELEVLADRLARADVATSGAGERARVNVSRAIKAAVTRIGEHEPELAHALRLTVRTGGSCSYQPDPGSPLRWEVVR